MHSVGFYSIENGGWLSHIFLPDKPSTNQSIVIELHHKKPIFDKAPAPLAKPTEQNALPHINQTKITTAETTPSAQEQQIQVDPHTQLSTHHTATDVIPSSTPTEPTPTEPTPSDDVPSQKTNTVTSEIETNNLTQTTGKILSTTVTNKAPLIIATPTEGKNIQSAIDDELTGLVSTQKSTLSDTFDIVHQDFLTPPSNTSEDDDFEDVFSPAFKAALTEAVEEQQKYLNGYIKDDGYQITKDSDGTRYVNIKGICWKIPPEGESGEWFIVPAGCNNQEDTFHFEFGFTPEMLNPNSPFSRLLGLEFEPNQ